MDIAAYRLYIIENDGDATGVGEPGLPPFSAALTNMVFDLTERGSVNCHLI